MKLKDSYGDKKQILIGTDKLAKIEGKGKRHKSFPSIQIGHAQEKNKQTNKHCIS